MRDVGRAVGRLNKLLPKRQFILIGPGRWGSRGDIKLGVTVTYSDINNTAMLIEVARQRGNYLPDLSFGTHFFQDLVEASIRYLPLYPDDPQTAFKEEFLRGSPSVLVELLPEFAYLSDTLRVIDVPKESDGLILRVLMNAESDRAVAYLSPPLRREGQAESDIEVVDRTGEEHWRWRFRMAQRIAAQVDPQLFGVKAFYLIGSTKNATAGPDSDIDLLLHLQGTEDQKRELLLWLEGWSRCLSEINFLRTGYRTEGLLDVHLITDADITARSSYAVKIDAITDPARKLPMKEEESALKQPVRSIASVMLVGTNSTKTISSQTPGFDVRSAQPGSYAQIAYSPETGMWEITIGESASIRQPHWHRHLDVKRPTRGCGAPKARVRHTSTRSRLFAQVDFRREMRPIAFVDPGAFSVTNPLGAIRTVGTL